MFLICTRCGEAAFNHTIERTGPHHAAAICPICAHAQPFRFRPLPVITGASGSGKSTLALQVAPLVPDVFCFENDVLWESHFDTPQDNYQAFRTSLLRVALNVNQSRVTTALFASVMPADLQSHPFRLIPYLVRNQFERSEWEKSADSATWSTRSAFREVYGIKRNPYHTLLPATSTA